MKHHKQHQFKSKLESKFWNTLLVLFKSNVSYESERIPYVLERKYVPDFVILRENGSKTYIETKGYLRPTDRTKLCAVKRNNPGLDLRIIFAGNDKIRGSKMRYSDWANKYHIPYSIGKFPREWIKS
jgi:predicted nuclease of restriction endonuclease-like RecB superfamily